VGVEVLVKRDYKNDFPLAICIVVYNSNLCSSPTFNSLFHQVPSEKIFIFDNSTIADVKSKNVISARKYGVNYRKTKNIGLGFTYNGAVNLMKGDCDYIGFFDQDTFIPKDYISIVIDKINNKKNTNDVFIPYVRADKKVMSPIFKKRYIHYKKRAVVKSAINSGMFVRTKIFENIKFDENLFLDYIDHDFFKKLNFNQVVISVLPLTLNQNFSDNEINLQKALKRFESYWKDTKEYCKVYGTYNYFVAYRHVLKLTMRYKSADFLKKVIFNAKS